MKKLNRRSFLKSVGKTIGGVLGLGVVGLPKAKATEETMCKFPGPLRPEYRHKIYMDFSPDSVVALEKIDGRFIVFCEHSIWEIEQNCYDDGWQRKQLCFNGLRSFVPDYSPILKVEYRPWDSMLFISTKDDVYLAAVIKKWDGMLRLV